MDRALRVALIAGVCAFAAALGWQRILAFDYGWHVRAGELIVALGDVPRSDTLSLSHQGQPWVDLHWLFQLALYGLRALGGDAAVVVAKSALVAALAGVALLRSGFGRSPALAAGCAAWMLVIAADRLIARPEIVSLLLLAVELALLERFARRPDRWIHALVPLHLLWANLHGLFAVGLAVAFIHWCAHLAEAALRGDWRAPSVRRLGAATLLSALATLLNPNRLTGALFPLTEQIRMLADPERLASSRFVGEFARPFSPAGPLVPLDLAAFAALAVVGWLAMFAARRRLRAADPLVWGALLYLALIANRNVALFAVAAAPIAARSLAALVERRGTLPPSLARAGRGALALMLGAATIGVVSDRVYPQIAYARETGLGLATHWYPEAAAAWIARARPPGPVANAMHDGGHLLAALPEGTLVLTDGRFAGLGDEARHFLRSPADLERLDARHHFGSVIVPYTRAGYEPLLRALARSAEWRPVAVDAASLLFVRSDFAAAQGHGIDLRRVRLAEPGADDSRAGTRRLQLASARLYAALDRPAEALAALEALDRSGVGAAPPALLRAQLLGRLGRLEQARREATTLAAAAPEDAWLHTALGNLALRRGDRDEARRHYESARLLDPSREEARVRLEALAELVRIEASGGREAERKALLAALRRPLPPRPTAELAPALSRLQDAAGPVLGIGLALLALRRRAASVRPDSPSGRSAGACSPP